MDRLQLKPSALVIATVISGLLIIFIETVLNKAPNGTLLFTLTFWVALVQGSVAVVAAADVSQGRWIRYIKKDLLAFYPLILFIAILSLFLGYHMDIYHWTQNPNGWMNETLFLVRNFVLLIISFFAAHFFAKASIKESENKNVFAVIYLLVFITTQSLLATDWIMSLEYPWISTMMPPLTFMESFYSGLAIAGLISAYLIRKKIGDVTELTNSLRDSAQFMFGFALAWAGLFYGQYLVIWYGNIPWETSFFGIRMSHSPYEELLYLTILILFIIPFVGLLPKSIKSSGTWVSIISFVVFIGLFIERIFYINPVASISAIWVIVEFVLMGFLFILLFANRNQFLKANVRG